MLLVAFVLALAAVALPSAASSSSSTTCSICAAGETIGLPDKSITITGYPTLTCSQIQSFADSGAVPSSKCSKLPQLSTSCGCTGGSSPTSSSSRVKTIAAPHAPTKKPVAPIQTAAAATSSTSSSSCSICPAGESIGNPDALITISSLGSLTCSQFEARASALSATGICSRLPSFASQCGCSRGGTASAPASSPTTPHATTSASIPPTSVASSSCSICPVGESIHKPNALVTIPNLGSLTCSEFESRAPSLSATGICSKLPSLASQCGCAGSSGSSPTFAPVASAAASFAPSDKPVSSLTVQVATNSSCSICPYGEIIANPDTLVSVPGVGSLTCSEFEARAVDLGATAVCNKLHLLAAQCGCISGGSAPSPTVATQPTAPSHTSCSICPAGKNITHPDALVTILNLGSVTCSQINARAPALAATGICSKLPQLVSKCGCSGSSAQTPIFPPVASAAASLIPSLSPSSSCSICPAGQTIRSPGVIINFSNIGSMNCSEIEARAPTLAATGICSKLSLLSSQCGCKSLNPSTPFIAPAVSPSYPPVTVTACSICPEGEVIGNPKQNVTSGSGMFTCSQLQAYANQRIISTTQCSRLPSFANACGCIKSSAAPSIAPAWQPSTPSAGTRSCSICPSGQTLKYPHMQVEIFGIGKYNCSEIQASADAGKVPADQCAALTTFAPECGCMASKPTTPSKPAAPASAPNTQNTTSSSCSMCAVGQTIGYPSRAVTLPGYPSFTCSQIQGFVDSKTIPSNYCSQLPKLATECGCSGGSAATPVVAPTIAPVAPPAAPSASTSSCSICAQGQTIGNPDTTVTLDGSTHSCQQIQSLADQGGIIPSSKCSQLPQLATTCGCTGGTATVPTIAPFAPSTTPIVAPTKPTCSICSAGQTLGNPDVIVDTGTTGKLSCQTISNYAAKGAIPSDQCSQLPMLSSTCGCTGGGGTAPTPNSAKPTSLAAPTCSICGAGQVVAHGTLSVQSSQGTFTCAQIEQYATQKAIPPNMCSSLPKLASTCGCKEAPSTNPASAPVGSQVPTVTSTYPPTQDVTHTNRGTSAGTSFMAMSLSSSSSWILATTIIILWSSCMSNL